MSIGSKMLREEAKRVYKENAKKYPKKQRMPFSEFFKRYKKAIKDNTINKQQQQTATAKDDFDFNDMVSLNNISDANLENKETK